MPMYVCLHACIYMHTNTCIYACISVVCIHTYIYTCLPRYTYKDKYKLMNTHTCICLPIYILKCMHPYSIYAYMCTTFMHNYICMCLLYVYTYTHIFMSPHMHMHMHGCLHACIHI